MYVKSLPSKSMAHIFRGRQSYVRLHFDPYQEEVGDMEPTVGHLHQPLQVQLHQVSDPLRTALHHYLQGIRCLVISPYWAKEDLHLWGILSATTLQADLDWLHHPQRLLLLPSIVLVLTKMDMELDMPR